MIFSDYIVFVDESGDHGLDKINSNYPLFVLAFCIFKKEDYIGQIVPALQKLKFKYWGHDDIILHEHDIRKSMSGDNEDGELELEFRRICNNASTLPLRISANFSKLNFNMRFVSKQANSLGLQLADLIARPIGLSVLKPNQENQAFKIIKRKFIKHKNGKYYGKGLKVFPA